MFYDVMAEAHGQPGAHPVALEQGGINVQCRHVGVHI